MNLPFSDPSAVPERSGLLSREENHWFDGEVRACEPHLRAYLRSRFPTLPDLDDVVQESYLRLVRARVAGSLRAVKGFLFVTARNVALDHVRHHSVIPMESLTDGMASKVSSGGDNAAETASLNQELEILTEAMQSLPERCRQILVLRRIHGLSHKAIAEQLQISEHTVEKQVGIGLKKCVEFLKRRGVGTGHHD